LATALGPGGGCGRLRECVARRIDVAVHLRDQERFTEVDALVAQMRRDVDATRDALAQAAAAASRA